MAVAEADEAGSTRPQRSWWQWSASTPAQAENSEKIALAPLLKYPFRKTMVRAADSYVNTLQMGSGPPLVIFHGLGAGLGLWTHNLPVLAAEFTVFAIDLPGFGRSGRPRFRGSTAQDGEQYFLGYLEAWREQLRLERFTLLGHSFGGYLAVAYSLRFPHRVQQLILADPWGIGRPAEAAAGDAEPAAEEPRMGEQLLGAVLAAFNPLAVVRAAGPWGPDVCAHLRPDLLEKFKSLHKDPQVVLDYVYHINAAEPTGEEAFRPLSVVTSPARPLLRRIPKLAPDITIHFIYGEHTWVERDSGRWLQRRMPERCTFAVVPGAGHHLYMDNPRAFNLLVLSAATGERVPTGAPVPESPDSAVFSFSVFEDASDSDGEDRTPSRAAAPPAGWGARGPARREREDPTLSRAASSYAPSGARAAAGSGVPRTVSWAPTGTRHRTQTSAPASARPEPIYAAWERPSRHA